LAALERLCIEAVCDADGLLLRADEPLASLQRYCGGTVPGVIAVPELRALVSKALSYGLRLARPITAQDRRDTIRAWIEVTPRAEGCTLVLRNWQTTPLLPDLPEQEQRRRGEIDRALAELTARLDARQHLLTVECDAPDLADLAAAMRSRLGQPWTEFVVLPGHGHNQPVHWRLLDGAMVEVAGSPRPWRASLLPQTGIHGEVTGFDLCLNSNEPPPVASPPEPEAVPAAPVIGRELAPILRQPIARIIANAETIRTHRAGPLPEDYARYAADIASAGQHLLGLVEDLADIEVIEGAGFAPAADRIDLADVARRAAGILQVRAREKGIVLHAPGPEAFAPAIGEFRRVLQILLNLIGNAIRYSPENSTVSLQVTLSPRGARLAVADQGPGVAPQDTQRVFDKFERLGRSGDGGSGLGLYISRRLARAMQGELSVESGIGGGARFVLDLPINDRRTSPRT
jgi:hypothetical protein